MKSPAPSIARPARFAAAAIGVAAIAHGAITGRWIGSGIALAAVAISAFVRARADLGAFAQRLLTLVALAAGAFVGWFETPASLGPLSLARGWTSAAVAALFAAALRGFVSAPEGGFFATFVIGLGAVVACGETRTGAPYVAFAVAYLLAGLAALRAHDDGRPALPAIPARTWIATAAQIAIAASVTVAFAIVLPPAAGWTRDRLLMSLGDATTGLGERMVLGSLEGMLQSEEIVARVYGPHTDYLRGVVYDHYQAGQWAASTMDGIRTVTPASDPARPPSVRVVFVGAGRNTRYLVPLGATSVWAAEGAMVVDRFGSLRPERGVPTEIAFSLEGGPPDYPPLDPSQDDRRMPLKLARDIRALVRSITAGAETPEAKIEAISRHLQREGRYSLQVERGPGDPLLDFLSTNRVGHCEYFASALVMLARASGVPARVVAGYRVAEHNALGDYDVVREKNAHAWAEVYIEGKGWQTVDPTPEDLLPQNRPHASAWLGAAWDLAGTYWSSLGDRLATLSLWELIVALSAVIVVGLVVRWWTTRRAERERQEQAFFRPEAPPVALTHLLAHLEARGHHRDAAETLERFAERLRADLPDAAGLLDRYTALRYGGVGDREALFADMESVATDARSSSRAPSS